MNNKFALLMLVMAIAAFVANEVDARGFGGFHGGGGGLHAGGLGGGLSGGGLSGGGLHAGGLGGGGFGGGVHPAGFGGAGGVGGFRAAGAQGFRATGPGGGSVGGFRAGGAQGFGGNGAGGIRAGGAEGIRATGPGGGSVGGVRAGGARGGFANPGRSNLNNFLGLPSDAGAHHIGNSKSLAGGGSVGRGAGVGPRGNAYAGRYATGPRGNTIARGAVAGPRGIHRVSAVDLHQNGVAIRSGFRDYGFYGRGWYGAHPGAWYPGGWANGTAWTAATWASLNNWMQYGDTDPVYYNYGTNVVYNSGNVYVNDQDVGSQEQYYDNAMALAETGTRSTIFEDQKWMPLGVFVLTTEGADTSNVTLQLAVDKAGTLRGNYTDKSTNATQQITGAVNKQQQMAAWTVGNDKTTVYQTGLYNLTKAQAPCLVNEGKAKTEQMLLVRLDRPKGGAGDQ